MAELSGIVVRGLEPRDVEASVTVFADSFLPYKPVQAIVGTDDGAYARLERFMRLGVRLDSETRVVVAESDGRIVGVMTIADTPACGRVDLRELATILRVAGPRILRAFRTFAKVDRVHPKTPHRHLQGVGVDPASQGQGIGRALVDDFVRGCDEARRDGYLETMRFTDPAEPSLPRFYEHHGFQVSHEIPMDDDWALVAMIRPVAALDEGR